MSQIVCSGPYAIITFISMEGQIPMPGEIWQPIVKNGVAGKAYIQIGYMGEPRQIQTVRGIQFTSSAAEKILDKSLQGHIVSVTDDAGASWYNLMVVNVDHAACNMILSGAGYYTGYTGTLTTIWTLDPLSTR